ncbi:MAG: hypothetical protein HY756_03700 [Nitrospirae bacterium]|nr:hypothetical protein [Nitrospirota bacterium]
MILNTFTIIMLFIALLTAVLTVPLGIFSLKISRRWRSANLTEEKAEIVDRSYLLLLMAVVILLVKLLSWPFFYVTLQSYVPHVRGAMCIFGVTQFNPSMSSFVQIFKPVVFFLIGGWLILNHLDKKTETSPLFSRKFLFLFFVSIAVFADSVVDLIYFTGIDTGETVACCTTFFDLPERVTAVLPTSILGREYERYLLASYYTFNVLALAFMGVSYRKLRSSPALSITAAGAALTIINAVVTVFAMFEIIAPKAMGLPYHHCIYCMWQYVPDTALMTAFFIIGTFSPMWAFLLNVMGMDKEAEGELKRYVTNLYFLGIVGLATSLIMATIHLVLK